MVIGGGIGGLAAALALKRIGVDVLVFERAAVLREFGAGFVVRSSQSPVHGQDQITSAVGWHKAAPGLTPETPTFL